MRKKSSRNVMRKIVIALAVILLFAMPQDVSAASQRTKAVKAYASFLSKTKYVKWRDRSFSTGLAKNCYFALACIDNNNVPELILYTPDSYHVAGFGVMYTYRNGKVVRVSELGFDFHSTLGYYKKKNVYTDNYTWTGSGSYSYERISGRCIGTRHIKYNYRSQKWVTDGYYWNNKRVSKASFNKALKKVVGNTKFTKYKFHKNTAANRKKYLR